MTTNRCAWASVDNPLMLEYHDREWGVPVHNDHKHFEFLVLSGAQAGLNFSVVLKKREGYRRAFDKFDPEKVAHYSEARIQKLRSDPEIIRNRMSSSEFSTSGLAFTAGTASRRPIRLARWMSWASGGSWGARLGGEADFT